MGFAAFVLATVGSLIAGHACLFCHEQDALLDLQHDTPAACSPASGLASSPPADLQTWGHRYSGSALQLTSGLVVLGLVLPGFLVRLHTPAGPFSEISHSMLGFSAALPHFTEEPNSFTARFSQVTYVVFAVTTILANLLVLLLFNSGKWPTKRLTLASIIARTLFAWSALDVALVSMVITLIELCLSNFVPLSNFERWLVEKTITGHPVPQPGLVVELTLGPGVYVLGVAVLLHMWFGPLVMGLLDAAALQERQREKRQHRNLCAIEFPSAELPLISCGGHAAIVGVEPADDSFPY